MLKKIIFITIVLLFLVSFCTAQRVGGEQYVKSLFKKDTNLEWIRHYKGRIDDLTDIAMTIGYDGEQCKAQLTYLRSAEKFNLEGSIESDDITLHEVDAAQQISGIWEGKIAGKLITGTWTDRTKLKGGKVLLEEVTKEATFPSYCGDNKWVRKYNGKIFGSDTEMIIQKESNHRINGVIYFQRKNESFKVKGEVSENNIVNLYLQDQTGRAAGNFDGILEGDFMNLTFKNKENNQAETVFSPDEGLTIGCFEFADYMTTYDIMFPKTTNAAFNKWMEDEADAWTKACWNRLDQNKRQNKINVPAMRAKDSGSAWCTVDYFSKKMISGFMTFTNSWTPGQKVVPFNFDLEKNSILYLEDIFADSKDYKKYIRNYIKKEIKKNKFYNDPEFKKWIKKEDFSLFTIRKDGICFYSKFNMLYGRHSVTIPYRQLKPFMKKINSLSSDRF